MKPGDPVTYRSFSSGDYRAKIEAVSPCGGFVDVEIDKADSGPGNVVRLRGVRACSAPDQRACVVTAPPE